MVEVDQPDRSTRRRRGKTDAVDAEAAARAALSGIARALPKSGDGQVEALRMLRLAKNSAVEAGKSRAAPAPRAGRGSVDPDTPEQLAGEASLAALCGVSPVEKSSGKSRRRRLNRGGDRQANAALHRIVVTRMRQDERTRIYLERRTAEGKGKREVMRCLKRYAAREVFRLIRTDMVTRHQQPDTSATLMTAA